MSAKRSRKIIEKLKTNLESAIDDNTVIFETYRELPEDLEIRTNIPRARVAIYQGAVNVVTKVGPEKPADARQIYRVDVSVLKAYRADDGTKGEMPALDLVDDVVDWIINLVPHTVTEGELYTLGYDSSTDFFRNKKYVTITINLSGMRTFPKQS